MLIRFSVENFLSFKERQTFSLIPGKGTLKSEHKTSPVKGISALKSGVILGANASGKSNLIKAIDFGRTLVVVGTKPDREINFRNFRLDSNYQKANSRIEYEIQHKNKNYAYGFVFNKHEIQEEWLYEITRKSDLKIFERNKEAYDLNTLLSNNKNEEEKQFLKFIAKGTPDNQLFLHEIKSRKVKENVSDIDDLLNVIDWFQSSLKIISPDEKYKEGSRIMIADQEGLLDTFEELLNYFDTGINGISLEKVEMETLAMPDKVMESIKEDMANEKAHHSIFSTGRNAYLLSVENEDVIPYEFKTKHKTEENKEDELFELYDESEGTNRILDMIPLLIDLLSGNNVFIVDEIERSLHPNLIYDMIDLFLSKAQHINSQLIIATHESSLLTQKLLRKDEVWFTVKDKSGATKLHSLEEYNIRFDKQLRNDYLKGRFKAIPRIGNRNSLTVFPPGIGSHVYKVVEKIIK
jgi:AAA15 family ATPase/GTPase